MSLEELARYLEPQRIVILGFGLEGHSTYHFLRKLFPDKPLALADRNAAGLQSFAQQVQDPHLVLHGGDGYLEACARMDYTLVLKSPGIPLKDVEEFFPRERMESQAGLFLKLFRDRVIGITGTKGKSTTAHLIYRALDAQGFDAMAVGNMGKPVLDLVFDDVPERLYVYEMSSHMLEMVSTSPRYAILLNIYQEHLDHYKSFSDYAEAKLNLLRFQKETDYTLVSPNVLEYCQGKLPGKGKSYLFDQHQPNGREGLFIQENRMIFHRNGKTYDCGPENLKRKLLGQHNLNNIMACLALLNILGVEDNHRALEAIAGFEGLEHRMEYVGEFSGIHFYNDSISTIPQAAICAVEAIGNVDTLIIGGLDRGIDYHELVDFLARGHVRNVICLPATGHRIYEQLKELPVSSSMNLLRAENMEEAVNGAFAVTRKGMSCLLSPAAASYGFYRNFEERGRVYKELVKTHG